MVILSETLAPWRSSLSRAIHRNRSQIHSRFFQLATVDSKGIPHNRTVVFRGFLDKTNWLQIITDSRSDKTEDLRQQPRVEICWYFSKTREQFRLAGEISIVAATETDLSLQNSRRLVWQNLSDAAREQFAWAEPKKIRDKQHKSLLITDISAIEPLDNFYLLLMKVDRVDYLELRGEPQNRYLYVLDDRNHWSVEEVNP